jgi:CheY-like chemotaxis protein
MSEVKQLVLLSNDLMFSSSISGVVEHMGAALQIVASTNELLTRANAHKFALAIIDLTASPMDLADLVVRLRQSAQPPLAIIAYGPHVHTEKLAAARAAGCDEVLTRGQMHSQMPEIIGRHLQQTS